MGVIFYQMLYGRRPFGEGMTQEAMARQGVLLNASTVSRNKAGNQQNWFRRQCTGKGSLLQW
jgi:hypothetical protein